MISYPRLASAALILSLSSVVLSAKPFHESQQPPTPNLPLWAYPDAFASNTPPPGTATQLTHVPGSTRAYTRAQLGSLFSVPDWFPSAHPPMPHIVAEGKPPQAGACGHCHLPNGFGRPENESIAGLPVAYALEQINDFKSGLRHSSDPQMRSVTHMIQDAKALTPEEAKAAIEYFASIRPTPWIHVVEADTVPKTHPAGGMMVVDPGTEPIGNRVLEVSANLEQTELRNPTSGFIAYAPTGSLARGKALVRTGGNGTTMACTLCHGQNLRGVGNIPSIAGRSPSQMTRQLIDFQDGSRNGSNAIQMKAPVARLNLKDMVDITPYLASLEP